MTKLKIDSTELGFDSHDSLEFFCLPQQGFYGITAKKQNGTETVGIFDGNAGFNKNLFKVSFTKHQGKSCKKTTLHSFGSSALIVSTIENQNKECSTVFFQTQKVQPNLLLKAGSLTSEHSWDLKKEFEIIIKINS